MLKRNLTKDKNNIYESQENKKRKINTANVDLVNLINSQNNLFNRVGLRISSTAKDFNN